MPDIYISPEKLPDKIVLKVTVITFCRLLLNTSRRFVYTFAPALSRTLGVPLTSITSLIVINQGTSVLGVFFAPLGDYFGYKLLMLAGLALLTAGMFGAGILPVYTTLLISLLLAGLGKSIFDPAIQAYVGHRVPFNRRGLIIGIMEIAWAGSTMIGIPLTGLLIAQAGWQSVFFTLGSLSFVGLFFILVLIPADRDNHKANKENNDLIALWKNLLKNRAVIGALGFSFFIAVANDNIFVVYAVWLEESFELSIVALGIGTSVIGAAEIAGELLTAFLSDKIGLKKAVISGLFLSVISFMVLPFTDKTLAVALAGLFFIFVSFEFTIVTAISLCTELTPESRATMMSAFLATAGLGRVTGTLIGGPTWHTGRLVAIGTLSAVFTLLALISLIWGLKYWRK